MQRTQRNVVRTHFTLVEDGWEEHGPKVSFIRQEGWDEKVYGNKPEDKAEWKLYAGEWHLGWEVILPEDRVFAPQCYTVKKAK